MPFTGGIAGYWERVMGTKLSERDKKKLEELAIIYGEYTVGYAIKSYGPHKNLQPYQFFNWFDDHKDDFPPDIVCGAYLTEDKNLMRLADELEVLSSAWFPDARDEVRIEKISSHLRQVLSAWNF